MIPNKRKSGVEVAGVRLSHPTKLFYPEPPITKQDLAEYYDFVSERMLPQVELRPLMLRRCPEGIEGDCFRQKHPTESFLPENLKTIEIADKDGGEIREYIYLDSVETLVTLAQIGTLEIHIWNSTIRDIEKPNRMVFDLDPAEDVPWKRMIDAAKLIRKELEGVHLESFVKTTGGKGLHIVVPLEPKHSWDEVKEFSRMVALSLVDFQPKLYTAHMSLSKRSGKIFVDYLRNARGSTWIAPYSTRAREGATISMPLSWDELTTKIHSDSFTLANFQKLRAKMREDPWKRMLKLKQRLPG